MTATIVVIFGLQADAFGLNCIAIAVSLGMLVPVIALAAGLVLLARRMLFRTLAALRRQSTDVSDTESVSTEGAPGEHLMMQLLQPGDELDDMADLPGAVRPAADGQTERTHFYPLPWGVVACVLLFHSIINDLFLVSIELYWGAGMVTGINWLMMIAVVVVARKRRQNEPRDLEADVEL